MPFRVLALFLSFCPQIMNQLHQQHAPLNYFLKMDFIDILAGVLFTVNEMRASYCLRKRKVAALICTLVLLFERKKSSRLASHLFLECLCSTAPSIKWTRRLLPKFWCITSFCTHNVALSIIIVHSAYFFFRTMLFPFASQSPIGAFACSYC